MPNVLAFKTPHIRCFLVFGVPNAKYLASGTLMVMLIGDLSSLCRCTHTEASYSLHLKCLKWKMVGLFGKRFLVTLFKFYENTCW